ncbi:LysR family transcriptional regulator, partial [Enterobacter roggenkampii]
MSFQVKFHHLRAFVEVARQGSIRGASRTLNLSQPALTKSIKELEEGMAAQLFVRRSKGVAGNDSNLLIVFYVQIMPDDFVMQLHR